MTKSKSLENIIRDLKELSEEKELESKLTVKPVKKMDIEVQPPDPPWLNEELVPNNIVDLTHHTSRDVMTRRPELVYLPMLLQSAWLPPQGSPEKYIRSFRNISLVSHTSFTPSGIPIGLPSGLSARRILLALVTKAVYEKRQEIAVPSIVELMRWCDLTLTGRSHKATQRNLLQLATMNMDIWFSPTGKKASIFKGQIFEELSVDIESSNQQKFSFIPDRVVFTEKFFNSVINDRPMPFTREMILKASSPIEHDLILWLCHRQSYETISKPYYLDYILLYYQFGRKSQDMRKFKAWFNKALRSVIKKFDRKIDIKKKGIVLHPMKPPVKLKSIGWKL